MPTEEQSLEARLTILEYRQDLAEKETKNLRADYTAEHLALRQSLQGIEKNLAAIKWLAMGVAATFLAQIMGLERAIELLSTFFI